MPPAETHPETDSLWYKDAVIYELHVRSFYDSNGDGIGDFRGLLRKLPYLRDLGITAIWLLPFYPSPLRDDGYDIADYFKIHPDYGTLADFQAVLREAHRLDIRVITELVLNHTSDQHPWFQKARRAKPGSAWRDFYVWSDSPDKYRDARIIFKDFEPSNWSWDPVANSYYWHRFYSHQPDLNYDNPKVHEAMLRVIDFWLGMGVDGMRLDAVPYLYEREDTNCENLPETYQFLKKLRRYVAGKYPDRMLLAEANQWPEDAASYLAGGELCHMAFHFPLMPRMFMALQMEDSFPITNILEQTPRIPDECQWALFLRNHDELTLEMVTDEERDYMYRVYARDPRTRVNLGIRRRLAPLMGNDRRKMELMYALLLSLPGTPIIYYGDEIGMGDNYYLGDRNGVRTPMQWSPDRNAGFSPTNPQRLHLPVIIDPAYHYETVNVENQASNPSSLLWWLRRLINLRRQFKAFGRGALEFIPLDNPKVLAFVRQQEEERILVIVNLSRFSQAVGIGLPPFVGYQPEDIFSSNRFPVIRETPYMLILGPHDYHILSMQKEEEAATGTAKGALPEITVAGKWENVLAGAALKRLEQKALPGYLRKCRWFGGKGRTIIGMEVAETLQLAVSGSTVILAFVEAGYADGSSDRYLLPLHYLPLADAGRLPEEYPEAIIARLQVGEMEGVLYDAVYQPAFHEYLLDSLARRRGANVRGRTLAGHPGGMFRRIAGEGKLSLASQLFRVEQSNSAIRYGDAFFFKLYRRVEEGMNPEAEIGRFLTDKARFGHAAPFCGALEYRSPGAEPLTLGILQGFVQSQGDAWSLTLHEVTQYIERVLAHKGKLEKAPDLSRSLFDATPELLPPLSDLLGGFYPEMARLLGQRTGELHLALASGTGDPAFAPEPFTLMYQRSLQQSMRTRTRKTMGLLARNLSNLPEELRPAAELLLASEQAIATEWEKLSKGRISALKTRTHGDYHLGQVLYTGDDFVIIDFEGEPARTMGERRIKHSPLRDVAGMIRSFHYAAYAVLMEQTAIRAEDIPYLEPWLEAWYRSIAGIFLSSYLKTVGNAPFMPKERGEIETLLGAFLLDKALYELGYELDNRPGWVAIPLRGIEAIINAPSRTSSPSS
ncbi:MAG: maltose alpha-D-glucosyltransferase [Geobacter sp.]|nr:maltose alpha-D-glucosyltransferase [Geobacter sp.]